MTFHPGGHRLRPYFPPLDPHGPVDAVAHMICHNCGRLDPDPGSDCVSEE